MKIEEVIQISSAQGTAVGQASLAQYVLKHYGQELSPNLTKLLEKVSQDSFETIGNNMEEAPEDIALQVEKILEKYT